MGVDPTQVVSRGDAVRAMQRHIVKAVIPANASWPEAAGGPVDLPPAFYWIRIDNRSPAGGDVLVSLDGPVKQSADAFGYWDRWNAGERRARNVGQRGTDAPAKELHLLNLGAVQATVWIELSMDPIVDVPATPSGSAAVPAVVQLVDGGSGSPGTKGVVFANDGGDGETPGFPHIVVRADPAVYNGATWDRQRSAGPAGTGTVAVGDISVFNVETTVALGASATFTGAWRDTLFYNWFAALALTDQAGTLILDEADAATPTVTNLVASVATAATNANAPSPPAAGQQARLVPTKTVLRFNRVRYINGATLQGRLNIQSAMSPIN